MWLFIIVIRLNIDLHLKGIKVKDDVRVTDNGEQQNGDRTQKQISQYRHQ